MPENYCLRVEEMRIWRDEKVIIEEITWRIRHGEHWALLGPNGSGKTSLLMAIAGYLPFGQGRLYLLDGWFGQINMREQRKRIGLVSQMLAEDIATKVFNITAEEGVLTGRCGALRLYDEITPALRAEARSLLAGLGRPELAPLPFKLLSTGQRQTVMLARTRMARSDLVLLDEPCAGLDMGARESFLLSLDALLASPDAPATIFITHHPDEIVPAISHVLLLSEGRAVASGPKDAVMTAPLLSETFGLPLQVAHDAGRFWVRAVRKE